MTLYKELTHAAEQKMLVEITPKFADVFQDIDTYLEPGMRAYLVGVKKRKDMLTVTLDVDSFLEYNKQFESEDWVNLESLKQDDLKYSNARDTGWYEPQTTFYWHEDAEVELLGECLTPLNPATSELMEEYANSGSSLPYMRWLEEKVIVNNLEDTFNQALKDGFSL